MGETKNIDVELENGEIVQGELETVELEKPSDPNREQKRRLERLLHRRDAKYARKVNERKMKKLARVDRKFRRKPSNFAKGA